jgi:hypothetical protein
MRPAPLFADACQLYIWLHGRLAGAGDPLARALLEQSLGLTEALVLALKGRDREHNIDRADERLIVLRVWLRLAAEVGQCSEGQLLHALELTDRIGRQLGGWQRSMGAV